MNKTLQNYLRYMYVVFVFNIVKEIKKKEANDILHSERAIRIMFKSEMQNPIFFAKAIILSSI